MSNVKFKLDEEGVKKLLKSQDVANECKKHADKVYARVSSVPGYKLESRQYPERNGYAIFADEQPAIKDNYENNSLLKSLA